jgi:hypothetical protein
MRKALCLHTASLRAGVERRHSIPTGLTEGFDHRLRDAPG